MTPKQLTELAVKFGLPQTEIVFAVAQCARAVLHLTRKKDRKVCLKAIEAAEKWSREPSQKNANAAYDAAVATAASDVYAAAVATAASDVYAADAAYYAAATAYTAADASYAAAATAYTAAKAIRSDESINQVILQHLPKLQRFVNLKAFL